VPEQRKQKLRLYGSSVIAALECRQAGMAASLVVADVTPGTLLRHAKVSWAWLEHGNPSLDP